MGEWWWWKKERKWMRKRRWRWKRRRRKKRKRWIECNQTYSNSVQHKPAESLR